MLRMAQVAIEEALAPLQGKAGPIPLLLGLPEQHTTLPLQPKKFLAQLACSCRARSTSSAAWPCRAAARVV